MYKSLENPLDNIDFEVIKVPSKMPSRYAGRLVSDALMSFDIETTSYFLTPYRVPVMYNYGNAAMKWNRKEMKKQGLMYHWQIAIKDQHFTGRTWEDLDAFFQELHKSCPALKIIYVHDLSFEFGFLPNILSFSDEGDKVLARESHRVITAYTKKYNIEFRCSYYLTQLSLDEWGAKHGIPKVSGFDFQKMRTPLTELTAEELAYCIRDVDIIVKGLEEYKKKYRHTYNIPITLTGEIRRDLRKVYKYEASWYTTCQKLQPFSLKSFKWMMSAFTGGCVLAAPAYKGETIRARFIFKDEASAYPWALISERYPVSKFRTVTNPNRFRQYMHDPDKTYIIEFSADNVQTRVPCLFLSSVKLLESDGLELVNGRIAAAKHIRLVLSKPDYETFLKCYFSDVKIHKIKISELAYLPDGFRKYVIEKYQEKVSKKYDDAEVYEAAKKALNSLFGINTQKLFEDETCFNVEHLDHKGDPDPWYIEELTAENFPKKLHDVLYNEKGNPKKIFIAAQIGIFCTAYARRNLWRAMLGETTPGVYSCIDDVLYADTDSVKMLYSPEADAFFKQYNKDIKQQHKIIAQQLRIKAGDLSPKDEKGHRRPLGAFEDDGDAIEFKTLGSKKYIYRDKTDGQLHLSVSGVPKSAVVCLHDDIENFREGFIFSAEEMHELGSENKMAAFYQYRQESVLFPDDYYDKYNYSVCLMPIDYTLAKTYDSYSDPDEFFKTIWKTAQETKLMR